jgi:alpha,alpha-trehalase
VGITTEGDLFQAVQLGEVFADSKTFVDAVPLHDEASIATEFAAAGSMNVEELRAFVLARFEVRSASVSSFRSTVPLDEYLSSCWDSLIRSAEHPPAGSSLEALPNPFVVPGGRFEELFYWDSYFTGLGLLAHRRTPLFAGMVDNLVSLLDRYGHIPNGSRRYLTSRSQPPMLAAMVNALTDAGVDGRWYLPALLLEHEYWTSGPRVVTMHGHQWARYWDDLDTPRPEAFAEDTRTAQGRGPTVFRHLRAAAASGWDFSSRWCAVPGELGTIETTEIIPFDLNALLLRMEWTIADLARWAGDEAVAETFTTHADRRRAALQEFCWDDRASWFCDLDAATGSRRSALTLAGVTALSEGIATAAQAAALRTTLMNRFLAPGGLRTSLVNSGEQWDAPNGWAPLQWWAVVGLRAYGLTADAATIANRWINTCRAGYEADGTLLEKYDVEVPGRRAGGGEYAVQEGFGWTNGVLIDLLAKGYGA